MAKKIYKFKCPQCSKAFKSKKSVRKFCSKSCSAKANARTASPKPIERPHLTCEWCKIEFIGATARRVKYCSSECAHNAKKQYDRDRDKAGRFNIFQRDNFSCIYCGRTPIDDGVKLAVDHIVPISDGGKDNIYNLVTSCTECNVSKHNKHLSPHMRDKVASIVLDRCKSLTDNQIVAIERAYIKDTKKRNRRSGQDVELQRANGL